MKRIISLSSLAVLTIGLLGSCSKTPEIKPEPTPDPVSPTLSDAFTVDETGTRVNFAKGNLVLDGEELSLAEAQTEAGSLFPATEFGGSLTVGEDSWTILSGAQWAYLLENNQSTLVFDGAALLGLAILPDGAKSDSSVWSELEEKGAVLLPAAGYAYGDAETGAGEGGSYWTSDGKALDFDCLSVYPASEAVPETIKQSVKPVKVVVEE